MHEAATRAVRTAELVGILPARTTSFPVTILGARRPTITVAIEAGFLAFFLCDIEVPSRLRDSTTKNTLQNILVSKHKSERQTIHQFMCVV